jgi:hypothetical protein
VLTLADLAAVAIISMIVVATSSSASVNPRRA